MYAVYTRAELPNHIGTKLTRVIVYGFSERPMMLLTNKTIGNKEDAHKVVWAYMSEYAQR